MDSTTILRKTEKGVEEVDSRKFKLDTALRRILILVDGVSSVSKLLEKGRGLPAIAETLKELEKQGFIVADGQNAVDSIKNKLIEIIKQTLGKDADKVVSKIQASPDTKKALMEAMRNCRKIVKLMIDEKKAEDLIQKCNQVFQHIE